MKKLIGITMGCPVGIGPEIIIKFFSAYNTIESSLQPVVLGDLKVMRHAAATIGASVDIVSWRPGEAVAPGTIPVCNITSLEPSLLEWGKPDAMTGKAMAEYIEGAVSLIKDGVLAGMTTCPIAKKYLNMAGYNYPGHTEMLAELTGTDNYLMMMAGTKLKVVLVTIHEPLRNVADLLTKDKITRCIKMAVQVLSSDFGMKKPRIAVAGFNPHNGEDGMFGHEEQSVIAPAIIEAKKYGDVTGPWSPDTVFHYAASGRFDVVVSMYHDQGLIPFKLLHFADGVNVTLGLPIVRTSVDHGTAYDIAGRGIADCSSLEAAYFMAGEIVASRLKKS